HLGSQEPRRDGRCRGSHPTVMINRAVPNHFEILRLMLRRRIRIRLIERVSHAHAFDRLLLYPIDHIRRLDAGGFEEGRPDVTHVMELRADAARITDVARPGNGHSLPRATEM